MIRTGTWIVLGLFVVLLAFAVWSSRTEQATPAGLETTPTLEPLWSVASEDIARIRVEDLRAGSVVEAQRDPDLGWELLQPETGPADSARLERAASWLALPVPKSSLLVAEEDLPTFGLSDPSSRVTAVLEDGTELSFEVGAEAPTGTLTYIRFPGRDGVLVLSKYGLSEVLGLLDPLPVAPTPTAEATQIQAPTDMPSPAPSATHTPASGATATP
jgi:hypothetical protein